MTETHSSYTTHIWLIPATQHPHSQIHVSMQQVKTFNDRQMAGHMQSDACIQMYYET